MLSIEELAVELSIDIDMVPVDVVSEPSVSELFASDSTSSSPPDNSPSGDATASSTGSSAPLLADPPEDPSSPPPSSKLSPPARSPEAISLLLNPGRTISPAIARILARLGQRIQQDPQSPRKFRINHPASHSSHYATWEVHFAQILLLHN